MKNNNKTRAKGRKTVKAYFAASDRQDPIAMLAKNTVSEWNAQKHPRPSSEEIELVNSIKPICCPHCESLHFVRKGKRGDGVVRYLSKECWKTFSPLTGRLLSSRKIPISEWFEFLVNVCSYESVSQSALTNMNAQSTGCYWIKKTFAAIEGCQDRATLRGRVYIDETYFKETPEGTFLVSGKKPRGLSKNLWCVATARDQKGRFCLVLCGRGKPSSERIEACLRPHIRKGSTTVHDGENSHAALVASVGGGEEVHPTEETKGLADRDNPLEPINELHRFLKKFMAAHGGYRRGGLQDWLNLFYMVFSSFGDPATFAMRVIGMVLNSKKVMRYRLVMGKKHR